MGKETLDKKTKKKYLNDLNLVNDDLRNVFKKDSEEITKHVVYTTYQPSKFGALSNTYFENMTLYLVTTYPEIFDNLKQNIIKSDLKILSKTYVSMMLFCSFLTSIVIVVGTLVISILKNVNPINVGINSVMFAFLSFFLVFGIFYFYPASLARSREGKINNDLPFMLIHMSAIAGSGTPPMSIFQLILKSKEYSGVHSEIKKIVNYVNLFGYDLSTALKAIVRTTPSARFKEVLNGIIANVQSGGDIKLYLNEKGEEALNTYRLERKKFVTIIATLSDIYIAVLIAAPLLFLVTLAIINVLGGKIAGLSLGTISNVGTFFVLPALNIAFLAFVYMIEPQK